jgi:hypothetical protein
MLFPDVVMKWQADSWKRVPNQTTGATYLLNTNRVDSVRELPNHDISLYYFDNPYDYRDNGHFMVINSTLAMMIAAMDYAPGTLTLTVAHYLKDNPTLATSNLIIPLADVAYAYAQTNHITRSWLCYVDKGWDIKTILVNNSLANLLFQVL